MLLDEINETHQGLYDFFYLPIDFKNRCNVGYAFMNFINFQDIVSFYHQYNGKKWRHFNSEKVRRVGFARCVMTAATLTTAPLCLLSLLRCPDLSIVLRPHPRQRLLGDSIPELQPA